MSDILKDLRRRIDIQCALLIAAIGGATTVVAGLEAGIAYSLAIIAFCHVMQVATKPSPPVETRALSRDEAEK